MFFISQEALLEHIKTIDEANRFIEVHCNGPAIEFHDYLNTILTKNKITIPSLIEASNINKNYCYNIINGTRKKPARDKVIALCIGSHMNLREAQEALDISMTGRLLASNKRDVLIAYILNIDLGNVTKANLLLSEYDTDPLAV